MTRVLVVEGEDASPEAVGPVVDLLEGLDLGIEFVEAGENAIAQVEETDCTLFGATSGPSARVLFHLRWGKATYANVRPIRYIPGARSPLANPHGIDFTIVRENLEDLYVGVEGDLATLPRSIPRSRITGAAVQDLAPGAFALKVITDRGCEQIIRHALALASERNGRLTISAKHNMLPKTDGRFVEIGRDIAAEHPEVDLEVLLIDDLAHRIVRDPHRFDVIALPNLYGDVVSDLAAGLVGGLGVAPSGCYGDDYAYFEPSHGTAPDIAGTGTINPTATLLAACMMLEKLGHEDMAGVLRRAVDAVYVRASALTPDQGGHSSAREFCDAVASEARRDRGAVVRLPPVPTRPAHR